jgi:hypothetical protein
MIKELIEKRASGLGFSTIAQDLKISRNTVKNRLREVGAYEVAGALTILHSGLAIENKNKFTAHWSSKLDWGDAIAAIEGGSPIKEYWEVHLESSSEKDLAHVPYETFWREFRRR